MPVYIDPSTKRKDNIVKQKLVEIDGVPLFSIVELNIIAGCTRSCEFCPVSQGFYKKINLSGRLKVASFEKLVSDLKGIKYMGKILFSGFSEPLIHPELTELLKISKKSLSGTRLEIVSNGDLASEDLLKKIFAAGLDTISISLYDGSHQIEQFKDLASKLSLTDSQVVLRRRYFEDGNYGLTISNRGGLITSNKFRDQKEEKVLTFPLQNVCHYPFYMIKLDLNGDVLLCSHDWQKKYIVGNFINDNIWDIWRGGKFASARKKLIEADRRIPSCEFCDVKGDLIGRESYEKWREFYKKQENR